MIACVPTARAESWIVAWPLVKLTGEPKFVPSTRNCTVPPLSNVPELGATVAVKVTAWPKAEGFGEELTVVVVLVGLPETIAILFPVTLRLALVTGTGLPNKRV